MVPYRLWRWILVHTKWLFGQYRWFRRLYGERWEKWAIDYPVASNVWIPAEICYYRGGERPPLGRGLPLCADWDD